ncbi:MAG: S9 family peptidase [Bryobacterales bacterium]|nr:S9 family peptidase [Bryobacterales bacterium]
MRNPANRVRATLMTAMMALAGCSPMTQTIDYPETQKVEQVDTYHGVEVADPYRWLEDDNSSETAAWVEAQNKVTNAYLDKISFREQLRQRLRTLYDYPKHGQPARRGEWYFFSKNSGLQNQNVWYIQKGLDGEASELLDPNALSPDGTTRLDSFAPSADGKYVAYALSDGGSDWKVIRVMEVATRKVLDDEVRWVKVSGIAWAGNGFFYSRYPAPEGGNLLSAKNENHQVWFHRVGTAQTADELTYQDPANPQRFHTLQTTEDERYAVLTISERGKGLDGNALHYKDLSQAGSAFRPIMAEITNDQYELVGNTPTGFLVTTNANAPNGKVLHFTISNRQWKDILPEQSEPLRDAHTGGGKLFATYIKDVASRVVRYSLEGVRETDVQLPGLGYVQDFGGRRDDTVVFYNYQSFDYPPTVFLYDLTSGESKPYRAPEIPGFDPALYETKQVFVNSKDGTKVPMFLVHKKGLALNGSNPTLLYGYGGFNVVTNPTFNSLRLAMLEQGFVYASCNMRGGGEYGETWHEAGTKLKKQNVFDDFIGAAEWLIANKYTSSDKLAVLGGSNGGLLVGAVINQRPELFRAAVPQVGVMDMLRFHKFTIGWNWIPDYGSSDDPEEFKALYAYSPIHNVRDGGIYPATLITTADHDDRVVPAHSFKYAATMQAKAAKDKPVIIRIETKSGHGASNTEKSIALNADIQAFLMKELGVNPKW